MQAQTAPLQLVPIDAADRAALTAMAAIDASQALEHQGCGWYESSYELGIGLVVIEEPDDCVFDLWLQAHGGRSLH